jgi:P2-related tail formation protein
VAEQELFDYILDWKKSWNTEEKRHAVAGAIRNLVLLGWMRARINEDLIDVA